MPFINDLRIHGAEARAALPGDTVLALSTVVVAYGNTSGAEPEFWQTRAGRVLKPLDDAMPAVPQPRGWVGKATLGAVGLAFSSPSIGLPKGFPEHWIGGRTCQGPAGSRARQVQAVIARSREAFLAVTDRRIALLDGRSGFDLMWDVPRTSVVGARRRPRLWARARFGLVFDDGSWIVLSGSPPHLTGWHAKQAVAVLGPGA